MAKRPASLLLRFFRIQELIAREQRRERPGWLRLMRLKRLALVLRQRLDAITAEAARGLQPVPIRVRAR